MRKLLKVSIISVVLLLPVLVFLFLKQFGSNEFNLPIYYADGNPLTECESGGSAHLVSEEFLARLELATPLILTIQGNEEPNKFKYDLENVLEKYPKVQVKSISPNELNQEELVQLLNCELVLGEDNFTNQPIDHKYVMIDSDRQIRGYFMANELDEIHRLDMELDILLNY